MKEIHGPLRTVLVLTAMVIAMLIGGYLAPQLMTMRGEYGPTIAQAQSPIAAAMAVVLCVGLCVVIGAVVARMTTAMTGLFIVGCGPGAMTMIGADVQGLVRDSSASLWSAAIESGIYALIIAAVALLIFRVARPAANPSHAVSLGKGSHEPSDDSGKLPAPLKALLCGAIVIPVVWLFAQSFMKGQVLWAVIIGGMVAGLVGRLVGPHSRQVLLVMSPCLFGAIAHGIGATLANGDLNMLFVERALWPTSLPMPLDYLAGTLIGVSMGVGWAKSFIHQEENEPKTQPASA